VIRHNPSLTRFPQQTENITKHTTTSTNSYLTSNGNGNETFQEVQQPGNRDLNWSGLMEED